MPVLEDVTNWTKVGDWYLLTYAVGRKLFISRGQDVKINRPNRLVLSMIQIGQKRTVMQRLHVWRRFDFNWWCKV